MMHILKVLQYIYKYVYFALHKLYAKTKTSRYLILPFEIIHVKLNFLFTVYTK